MNYTKFAECCALLKKLNKNNLYQLQVRLTLIVLKKVITKNDVSDC